MIHSGGSLLDDHQRPRNPRPISSPKIEHGERVAGAVRTPSPTTVDELIGSRSSRQH